MLFNLWRSYNDDYGSASPLALLRLNIVGDDTDEIIANLDVAIRKGFPATALRALQSNGLGLPAVAVATGLAETTLKRRLSAKRLDPIESDRLLRLASVIGTVMDELSLTIKEALQWMNVPIDPGMSDDTLAATRLSLCATEAGIVRLEQILQDDVTLRKAAALRRDQERRNEINAVARRSRVRPTRQNDAPAKERAKPKDRQTNFAPNEGIDETSFKASTQRLLDAAPAPIRDIARFAQIKLPTLTREAAWGTLLESREILEAPAPGTLHVAFGMAFARHSWVFRVPKLVSGRMSREERDDLYDRVGHALPAAYAVAALLGVSLIVR